MSKYNEAKNKEAVLEVYKQKAREHFQKEAANTSTEDKDFPHPPAPIPKDVAGQYKITQEDLQEARRASLDELSEDTEQSEENRRTYSEWYVSLYAPPAPILDFKKLRPSPPMVRPTPPTDPYPVATPPKEPPPPSPEQALQDIAFEHALKEADVASPPSTPPPPLSAPPPLPGAPLDFSKYPVPTMVSSEGRSKRGLFGMVADWLKGKVSNSKVRPVAKLAEEAKSTEPSVSKIPDAPYAVPKLTVPGSSASEALSSSNAELARNVLQKPRAQSAKVLANAAAEAVAKKHGVKGAKKAGSLSL